MNYSSLVPSWNGKNKWTMVAFQRQKEYEEEDQLLQGQFEPLKYAVPASFKCGICLEEETEVMTTRLDPSSAG